MANMTTILNQLSDFKFHDKKLQTVLGHSLFDFAAGHLDDIDSLHLTERSVRIRLTDGRGDFWLTWFDDKCMSGCGCTVEGDQCYLYWKDGEPLKAVKDRIRKVYDLFVMYLNTKNIQKELKEKYDATLNDVIR